MILFLTAFINRPPVALGVVWLLFPYLERSFDHE